MLYMWHFYIENFIFTIINGIPNHHRRQCYLFFVLPHHTRYVQWNTRIERILIIWWWSPWMDSIGKMLVYRWSYSSLWMLVWICMIFSSLTLVVIIYVLEWFQFIHSFKWQMIQVFFLGFFFTRNVIYPHHPFQLMDSFIA